MPYSGADDEKLPDNIKKLPAKQRAQWVAVWNSSYKACENRGGDDCESAAYRTANGVLKRQEANNEMTDSFQFVDLALSLYDGKIFDALAPGKFVDMFGRTLEIKSGELPVYVENTRKAIEATKSEGGELVGLPIDASNHDKGDGAGWIVDVTLENDRVRVTPKWTEIGLDLISKGIRRFFSATVDTTRKVIMGGTLTNWPASRDHKSGLILLRPVELSQNDIYSWQDSSWLDELKSWLNERIFDLMEFDDSEWDGGAVSSKLDVADLRKCVLLDLNGYPDQDGEAVKGLCKLPYKKSPGSAPNRNAIKAMAGGHGFPSVKKPEGVPGDFYKSKLASAAKRAASLWRQAFDTDVPEGITRAAEMSDHLSTEDNLMALELTQEQLDERISAVVETAVGSAVASALEKALGANPIQPQNGNDQPENNTADLVSLLGLDDLEEGAQKRIELALSQQMEAIQKSAETRYMQQLAQVTRKRDIAELAQRVTGGTPENPRGLPVQADDLAKHLLALPKEEAKFWQELCQNVVEKGLVEFAELGHARDVQGVKELPAEIAQAIRAGELKVSDLGDPILALGDLSEYNLAAFEK